MTFKETYTEGQFVYLRTDPDQLRRVVSGYDLRGKQIRYWLRCETEETLHYEFEITDSEDVVYKTAH